eukprot:5868405-Prymnesium_polylepis.1
MHPRTPTLASPAVSASLPARATAIGLRALNSFMRPSIRMPRASQQPPSSARRRPRPCPL